MYAGQHLALALDGPTHDGHVLLIRIAEPVPFPSANSWYTNTRNGPWTVGRSASAYLTSFMEVKRAGWLSYEWDLGLSTRGRSL